jgi:superfamily II DNA or RNA helicase
MGDISLSGNGPEWTSEQRAVIEAAPDARILVDAGPGTGKTAVACARVAWLIDSEGLAPNQIVLVSFTRTAVHELKQRISEYLSDPDDAVGIRIGTLDSLAWSIRSGFEQDVRATGSYESSISALSDLVRSHQGVAEYLRGYRHLLIDEAQDIMSPRAELVLDILSALPDAAGATVLSDEAQAIYGFSEDGESSEIEEGATLPDCIRAGYLDAEFQFMELTEIHRTDDPQLKQLFREGRSMVRNEDAAPETTYADLRELIVELRHDALAKPWALSQDFPDDLEGAFFLFRKRGEALQVSNYFGKHPRRLRLSGLPAPVQPWVADIFWDYADPEIGISAFLERWEERYDGAYEGQAEEYWDLLTTYAGRSATTVDVQRLTKILARSTPPADFTSHDFGTAGGPIIGTVHAAKGREAETVCLFLPAAMSRKSGDKGGDDKVATEEADRKATALLEEARVLFVGATRARSELRVHDESSYSAASTLEKSGRAFTIKIRQGGPKVAVEIGRDGDITAEGLVGRGFFELRSGAIEAQQRLMAMDRMVTPLTAFRQNDLGFVYSLHDGYANAPSSVVGYLDQQLNRDLFEIAHLPRIAKNRTPSVMPYLTSLGLRTLVVPYDSDVRQRLHSPWRESGIMFAPLLTGYTDVRF